MGVAVAILWALLLLPSPAPCECAYHGATWRALPLRETRYWAVPSGLYLCDDPGCGFCGPFVWGLRAK